MKNSNGSNAVRLAYDKGYRVDDSGNVVSPFNGNFRKLTLKKDGVFGHYRFTLRGDNSSHHSIPVHSLAGYQKFGEESLKEGVEVRHLNDYSLDNSYDNIGIGTRLENAMDIPPEKRMKRSINASTKIRKFSDKVMEEIRNKRKAGATYSELMYEYDISSKGTMSHIVNNEYVTKV